jgi:6-phosphofructokinase 1
VDLREAREVGRAAVRLALSGETQRMVTLVREGDEPYRWHTDSAPLSEIANRQWLLPDDYLTPDGRDTTDAFRRYALPLLGPEPLPRYTTLEAKAVAL